MPDEMQCDHVTVPLRAVAHAHSGDKGDRSNISVIPFKPDAYRPLLDQLTTDRIKEHFRHRPVSNVTRYELPNLPALNFVLDAALEGGVNRSLGLDGHGQSLSFFLLTMLVTVPKHCILYENRLHVGE